MKHKFLILLLAISAFFLAKKGYKLYSEYEYYTNISRTDTIQINKNLLHEVTILTSSYDGYSELWDPHYKLLFKYWPSLKNDLSFIPIMLLTNELEYQDDRVISLKIKEQNWSKNLIEALKHVKTKYTLLLIDDYIINAPVNEERFIELLSLIEQRDGAYVEVVIDTGHFKFSNEKEKRPVIGIDNVIYRSKNSNCRNSLQAAIWNSEELRKLINPNESAWDFEIKGSARTRKNSKPFFLVTKDPVMSYFNGVAKKIYEKDVVDYINSQGIEFAPKAFPIKTRQEIDQYLKTKEAKDMLLNYHGNKE